MKDERSGVNTLPKGLNFVVKGVKFKLNNFLDFSLKRLMVV
jgi:hypothetical protein